MKLTSPSELKAALAPFGFSFSKSLGQNFLIDENVLNKIIASSGADKNSGAFEIGPGAGTLTRALAESCRKAVAVEIDNRLIPVLSYTLSDFKNTKIINNDIMKVDINAVLREEFGDIPVIVCANLPYYISTPVIMKILEECSGVKSITVMVQKEVANRMTALPGGKDYGALSLAVQYYTKPHIVCCAEPHCFFPQPKVSSSVVTLDVLPEPSADVLDKALFFKIIKSAFGQRRKTLLNALSKSPYINFRKSEIESAINSVGLPLDIRGERLSISDFANISNHLTKEKLN